MNKFKKLAIFGGTFSPFHNGHIAALKAYAATVKPDVLYVIPTATPPHKSRVDTVSDIERLTMVKMAVEDLDIGCELVVSDIEIARGGKSYTIDTVEELKRISEQVIIYCGTDMLLTLEKWYHFEKLLSMVTVAYMQRECDLRYETQVKETVDRLHEKYSTSFIALPPVSDEISSTMIRKMVEEGKDISGLVPLSVSNYIYNQRLYNFSKSNQNEENLDSLRRTILNKLGDFRAKHVLSTEEEAARIAAIYLPHKVEKVRISALLHDITKEYDTKKQLQILSEFGIIVDNVTKRSPKVFHATTAALLIPHEYPEYADEEVISAVRNHTTGNADMSIMDMIIYLADYIEPLRRFDDCKKLRQFFWGEISDCSSKKERLLHLYKTMVLSFDLTIENLIAEHSVIAKDTFAARNAFVLKCLSISEETDHE